MIEPHILPINLDYSNSETLSNGHTLMLLPQQPTSDACSKAASKTPAKSKRAALVPLGVAVVAPKQRQQSLEAIQASTESWANIHIPPVPCLNVGEAHFTREAAHILNSPPCHESDKGQFFVGSSVEENRWAREACVYDVLDYLSL